MALLGMIGLALMIVGGLWLIFVIFSEGGVLWGIGSLIIPLVALIYVAMNWKDSVKKPFMIWASGWAVMILARLVGG